MSNALERLQNYHAEGDALNIGGRNRMADCPVFDKSTPEGAFLNLVQNRGYKLYDEATKEYTELYYALTTSGNQKIQAIAGSGKALANTEEVITPYGYKAIGSLVVGDRVLGEDGEFHDVLGVYPQGLKKCFRMPFSNGKYVVGCMEHIWTFGNGNERHDLNGASVYEALKEYHSNYDFIATYCSAGLPHCRGYAWDESVLIPDSLADELVDQLVLHNYVDPRLVFAGRKYVDKAVGILVKREIVAQSNLGVVQDLFALCGMTLWIDSVCCESIASLCSRLGIDEYTQDQIDSWFSSDLYCQGVLKCCSFGVLDYEDDEGIDVLFTYPNDIDDSAIFDDSVFETETTCIAVDNPSHLFVCRGGIPTHNTTSLIFKIMHDIVTGEIMRRQTLPNGNTVRVVDKVFVGTFLKSGALELQRKLAYWQKDMGYTITSSQITFGTLHAEFKHCLNAMGVETPIGNQQTLSGLLRRAIDSCNITRQGENLISEDYKIIESIVTYSRGRLDEKRYQHPSVTDYELTPSILDMLINQYNNLKVTTGVMDFEDLEELLYKYLYTSPNPAVQDFVASRYNYIYLDEFQDTSQIQYAILKFYGRGWLDGVDVPTKGKIVVVGDVQQCIYSFRGSDINVMHRDFDKDFMPTHNSLSYNYRCPSEVLNPVIDSIMLNPESTGIEIKPFAEGGEFCAMSMYSTTQMLKQLELDLQNDMEIGNTVGVLCRTNYDGMIPALFMEMNGHYRFSISSEAMTLSTSLPRSIVRVAKLFTEKGTPAIKTVLKMFVGYRDVWMINRLCDTMKQNRLSIWTVDEKDLEYSCKPLYGLFSEIKKIREEHGDLVALRTLYYWLAKNKFGGDTAYSEGARSCIEVMVYLIDNSDFNSVLDFEEEVESLNERLKARIGKNYDIAIATVHEFKGKERDSIYVWNDSDGVFPGAKVDLNNDEQVNEERRVHYIACTRARKKCHIYTKAATVGMFLKEMDCTVKPVTHEIGGKL